MLIHDQFYCEGSNSFNKFFSIVKYLNKRQSVEFAFYCAKDVFHLVEDRHKEVVKLCLDLTEKWLHDENSVTSEELRTVGDTVAFSSFFSNDRAGSAADSIVCAICAVATFNPIRTATRIAYAGCHAHLAWKNPNNKLNEYLVIVNSYFTKATTNCPNYEIEGKILYLIDELEENIIVHKDKYYINMNGIENCPEYGFDTQQELLEKLLYSEDQFWEFARNWLDNLYKNQQT